MTTLATLEAADQFAFDQYLEAMHLFNQAVLQHAPQVDIDAAYALMLHRRGAYDQSAAATIAARDAEYAQNILPRLQPLDLPSVLCPPSSF